MRPSPAGFLRCRSSPRSFPIPPRAALSRPLATMASAGGRRKRDLLARRRRRLRSRAAAMASAGDEAAELRCARRWRPSRSTSSSRKPSARRKKILHRRHGFDHDRPGMHRRTGRRGRPQGPCRRDHRALDERRDRLRAGAARARRAAEGSRRCRSSTASSRPADAGVRRARRWSQTMRAHGAWTALVSGGFDVFTARSPKCSASTRTAPTG